MALESPAYVISASSHSAALFRQTAQTMLLGAGCVESTDLAVTAGGSPAMSVNVAAGMIWMPGTLGSATGYGTNQEAQTTWAGSSTWTSQGSYCGYQDATVNLTIAAADPTNPRIDLVCAAVQDAQYSGSNNQPVLSVVTGTPAGSPSYPTPPASAIVLAYVNVTANLATVASGNIVDVRPFVGPRHPRHNARAEMYRTSAITLTSTAVVQFDTVGYDPSSSITTGSTAKFTCPVDGVYQIAAGIGFTPTSSTTPYSYSLQLWRNSVNVRNFAATPNASSSAPATFVAGTTAWLASAGDTLQVVFANPSGAGVTATVGRANTWASFTLLSRPVIVNGTAA